MTYNKITRSVIPTKINRGYTKMIMKFMVQYGSLFDYYATKEEAIADAINGVHLGIRRANFLFKLNEKTNEYEKIGEFGRK